MELSMNLKSKLPDGRRVATFIRPENKKGLLLQLLPQLPKYKGKQLSRVQLYTMADNSMCINMFTYGMNEEDKDTEKRNDLVTKIKEACLESEEFNYSDAEIEDFTSRCKQHALMHPRAHESRPRTCSAIHVNRTRAQLLEPRLSKQFKRSSCTALLPSHRVLTLFTRVCGLTNTLSTHI